jgi:hypothetical protein
MIGNGAGTAMRSLLVRMGSHAGVLPQPRGTQMRKGLAVFVAVAMAAGIVVLWRPATATAATPGAPAAHHPTTRVCPDNGKLLACFAIRQTDTVVPNRAADALPDGFRPADLRSAYGLTTSGSAAMSVAIVDAYDDRNADIRPRHLPGHLQPAACTTANGRFREFNESGKPAPCPGRTPAGPAKFPGPHVLNDVTSRNNGTCVAPLCTADSGYDSPTGLGTSRGTSAFSLRAASSTTLTSSANPSTFGQPVTFTVVVTSTGGTRPAT